MTMGQTVLLLYGVLMIVGGAMGYRAGSNVSLYAGGGSGLVLIVAFVISRFNLSVGLWIGTVVGALLAGAGALDEAGSEQVADLLLQLNAERKVTLVVVTHNVALAERMGTVWRLKDGKLEKA